MDLIFIGIGTVIIVFLVLIILDPDDHNPRNFA